MLIYYMLAYYIWATLSRISICINRRSSLLTEDKTGGIHERQDDYLNINFNDFHFTANPIRRQIDSTAVSA
jgi:hypothetical protein